MFPKEKLSIPTDLIVNFLYRSITTLSLECVEINPLGMKTQPLFFSVETSIDYTLFFTHILRHSSQDCSYPLNYTA